MEMPNWSTQTMVVEGSKKQLEEFLATVCTNVSKEKDDEYVLDFFKIIPEPATKEDCPERFIIKDADDAKSRFLGWDETKDRNWFDWYNWHIEFWGTKWDARYNWCDIDLDGEEPSVTLCFDTAWSYPTPIIETVMKLFPDLFIIIGVTEEGGYYAGITGRDSLGQYVELLSGEDCDLWKIGQDIVDNGAAAVVGEEDRFTRIFDKGDC